MTQLPSFSPAAHQTDPHELVPDPYRIFFPLGVLAGLIGVGFWPAYALGWFDAIQSQWHIDMQLYGFLFAFILGFLLTALPRFSVTFHITKIELGIFVGLYVLTNLATGFGLFALAQIGFVLTMTALIIFAARRFMKRKADPPDQFLFVGAALLLGWLAGFTRVAVAYFDFGGSWELAGRRMLTEGMVLMLVLGIGGKLAPMFWGHATGSPIIPFGAERKAMTRARAWYIFLAAALSASFAIEYAWSETLGLWIRALAATAIFIPIIGILKWPKTKGVLVRTLQVSMWMMALSPWGAVIHRNYRVETLHVMFVGGFAVLILTIATRVILSHGNYPIELERSSRPLAASCFFLLAAMLLRSIAALFPESYFQLLGFAGGLWIVGLTIWGVIFSRRAIVVHRLRT